MKLHIFGIGNSTWESVNTRYTPVTRTLTTEKLKVKKEHNKIMLEIVFALTYSEYDDININSLSNCDKIML